jgi:hypothetical protein
LAHNAAIALLVASTVVAVGGYAMGRWQYDGGGTISRRAVALALTGIAGIVVAVALLAAGV